MIGYVVLAKMLRRRMSVVGKICPKDARQSSGDPRLGAGESRRGSSVAAPGNRGERTAEAVPERIGESASERYFGDVCRALRAEEPAGPERPGDGPLRRARRRATRTVANAPAPPGRSSLPGAAPARPSTAAVGRPTICSRRAKRLRHAGVEAVCVCVSLRVYAPRVAVVVGARARRLQRAPKVRDLLRCYSSSRQGRAPHAASGTPCALIMRPYFITRFPWTAPHNAMVSRVRGPNPKLCLHVFGGRRKSLRRICASRRRRPTIGIASATDRASRMARNHLTLLHRHLRHFLGRSAMCGAIARFGRDSDLSEIRRAESAGRKTSASNPA